MKYTEEILEEAKALDGVSDITRKALISENGAIRIEKRMFVGRHNTMTYYLPVKNNHTFYLKLIESFKRISGASLHNTTPRVYEDSDGLDNSNYSKTFYISGDKCQVNTSGLAKQCIIYIDGFGVVTNERRYDELVIRSFEDAVKNTSARTNRQ